MEFQLMAEGYFRRKIFNNLLVSYCYYYHNFYALKQHEFIPLKFWRSEI